MSRETPKPTPPSVEEQDGERVARLLEEAAGKTDYMEVYQELRIWEKKPLPKVKDELIQYVQEGEGLKDKLKAAGKFILNEYAKSIQGGLSTVDEVPTGVIEGVDYDPKVKNRYVAAPFIAARKDGLALDANTDRARIIALLAEDEARPYRYFVDVAVERKFADNGVGLSIPQAVALIEKHRK